MNMQVCYINTCAGFMVNTKTIKQLIYLHHRRKICPHIWSLCIPEEGGLAGRAIKIPEIRQFDFVYPISNFNRNCLLQFQLSTPPAEPSFQPPVCKKLKKKEEKKSDRPSLEQQYNFL